VLAGDHLQLPPTVLSKEAAELNQTLFERWMNRFPQAGSMLLIQYRMHAAIMQFSNEMFYEGRLKASPRVAGHHIGQLSGFQQPDHPAPALNLVADPAVALCFVDVPAGREEQIPGSFSYFNKAEAAVVSDVVATLLACRLFPMDIGIISPYDQQVNTLRAMVGEVGIEIKSVDGYQGREKEVIVISTVRANDEANLGFLTDLRRLNVALTRARRKLIIVGHQATLSTHPAYARLLHQISDKGHLTSMAK
jgi:superfamily I DNA and/or RNA helicase